MEALSFIQNLQMPELIVIFIAVLLIFGPKNLPKLGRALGQTMREFKDATNKITESINDLDKEERRPPTISRDNPRRKLEKPEEESSSSEPR